MRVNLVTWESGAGNSRDIVLLRAALVSLGCDVSIHRVGRHERRRRRYAPVRAVCAMRMRFGRWRRARQGTAAPFDLTVMLEHIFPEQLHVARVNVFMPNPEFADRHDRRQLAVVDRIWAKTACTQSIFESLGCATSFTGFDSEDRHDPQVPRETAFLHLAGKSRMKGTVALIELWARHPEWPPLTVIQTPLKKRRQLVIDAPNIRYERSFLDDARLREIQNRHRFHLCPSEAEGWGHYITEGLSTGAVVLATDAAPMNELVTRDRGLLIPATEKGRQHLSPLQAFEPAALEQLVPQALALDAAARDHLCLQARAWFLDNKRTFPGRLRQALTDLDRCRA